MDSNKNSVTFLVLVRECNQDYIVGRQETPGLKCKGCGQGFHQPCLEKSLDGKKALSSLPGSLYWLCGSCGPCYELVTTVGQGGRNKPTRKRIVTVPGGDTSSDTLQHIQPVQVPNPVSAPSATVRSRLPYLWAGVAEAPETVQAATIPPPQPPPLPSAAVRSGLPFLWQEAGTSECQQYLLGTCPHGISGKVNGVCSGLHKKRCGKYMKWGSENDKGCSSSDCDKAHPILCPSSHQLKCVDQACTYKLHTSKCVRNVPVPTTSLPADVQSRSIRKSTHDQPVVGVGQAGQQHHQVQGRPWLGHQYSIPPPTYNLDGQSAQNINPGVYNVKNSQLNVGFQQMTAQHLLEAQARYLEQ